ncbi:MAG: hypothetical protein R3B40_04970 [Polyangiales bacterium]
MGHGVTFRGRRAFFAPSEDIEKLARKRLAKEWRKRDWKRERELPKAVEAGAAALIEAAARKIAERIEQAGTRPPQGAQQRVRVDPAPKAGRQVRVDASGAPTGAPKEAELERDILPRARRAAA